MSQTIIDFSQDYATWVGGDGADLNEFTIDASGSGDPDPWTWANLVNSYIAAAYGVHRGAACSVKGRSANSSGAIADIALANGEFLGRRSDVVDGYTLTLADLPSAAARSVPLRAANSAGARADLAGTGTAAAPQILTDDGTALAWTAFTTVRSNASTLYEVNFSTLANNTFVDGAETIDGLAYTAFNMAELGTAAVQNGTGIRMITATSNGGATTMTSASQLIPYISVPFSQISGYDSTATYIIEIYCPSRVLEANGEYVTLGLYGAAAGPFASSTARMRAAKLVRNAGDTADVMRNTLNATDSTGDVAIDTHNVIAIKVDGTGIGQVFSGIWSAGWPTSYTAHSSFPTGALADSPLNTGDVRIFMGLGCANDASPSTAVTIERMRIRKVS
jgi:hypothetical protein